MFIVIKYDSFYKTLLIIIAISKTLLSNYNRKTKCVYLNLNLGLAILLKRQTLVWAQPWFMGATPATWLSHQCREDQGFLSIHVVMGTKCWVRHTDETYSLRLILSWLFGLSITVIDKKPQTNKIKTHYAICLNVPINTPAFAVAGLTLWHPGPGLLCRHRWYVFKMRERGVWEREKRGVLI